MVSAIVAYDDLESEHRRQALDWLERTDDVFRRAKPATPDRHLVSYIPVVDRSDGSTLLVKHINAGLWLPPGGHVEPDEHPADTARREAAEELGIRARFYDAPRPSFVTVTLTGGIDRGHTDVSLWFALAGTRAMQLTPDAGEFSELRWWSPEEIRAAPPAWFDPHYLRFTEKMGVATTEAAPFS